MHDRRLRSTALRITRKRLWIVGSVLILGSLATGCDQEVVAVGSCSIHSNEAGQPTLVCPDGSSRNLATQLKGDGVCSVETDGNGVVQMTCDDGRTHSFDGKTERLENSEGCELRVNADGGRDLVCGDLVETISTGCAEGFPGDVFLTSIDSLGFGFGGDQPRGEVSPERLASFHLFRLSGCRAISGDLVVVGWNESRLPVSLELVETIGGELRIRNSSELKRIDFARLTEVGGLVSVFENEALTALSWKDELSAESGVRVESNPALPSCKVTALFERTNSVGDKSQAGNSELCP